MNGSVAAPVRVANPKLGYLHHQPEFEAAYGRVMTSGWYVLGDEVAKFEAAFASYCGVEHAVGVASGTDAITLMLIAAGIGPGDEVLTTPLTAAFTALAIERAGATPVFGDIDPTTYCLDPQALGNALTPKTKAVLPVHLYGQPADLTGIHAALQALGVSNILMFEDASQAHGARLGPDRVGSLGRAAAFSFYPTKNLGAFGDGGLITTKDADLADTLRRMRDGGQSGKDHHVLSGFNSRLDELQAAFLSVRLKYLDADNARRAMIAERYTEAFQALDFLTTPGVAPGRSCAWHLYVVRTLHRAALQDHLKKRGILSSVHYPRAVHQQPFVARGDRPQPTLPIVEHTVNEILSLPLYPELTDEEVARVIAAVTSLRV